MTRLMRPTSAQVEAALTRYPCLEDVAYPSSGTVLAAEVRALREELEAERAKSALLSASLKKADAALESLNTEAVAINTLHDAATVEVERMQVSIDLYRATIARVEALPAAWRTEAHHQGNDSDVEFCAQELEAALRGSDG